jgi:hypothetical protein
VFLVDGVPREYDFTAGPGLDPLVLYEPGRPPVTAQTLEPERVTSFFGGPTGRPTPDPARPRTGPDSVLLAPSVHLMALRACLCESGA